MLHNALSRTLRVPSVADPPHSSSSSDRPGLPPPIATLASLTPADRAGLALVPFRPRTPLPAARSDRDYVLKFRQQPRQARMCGVGDKGPSHLPCSALSLARSSSASPEGLTRVDLTLPPGSSSLSATPFCPAGSSSRPPADRPAARRPADGRRQGCRRARLVDEGQPAALSPGQGPLAQQGPRLGRDRCLQQRRRRSAGGPDLPPEWVVAPPATLFWGGKWRCR